MTMQLAALIVTAALLAQVSPRMANLMEAVRPALPFPESTRAGDLPADNRAEAKWFVVWPRTADDTRIVVRANPLNPDVQQASAEAMQEINQAVAAAERRVRESYDRAVERLRQSGTAGDIESISLDDEGVAGERIDAELEVTIAFAETTSVEIHTGEPPTVRPGGNGAAWIVRVPGNTYRSTTDNREHFCAAEARVYIGVAARPEVTRIGDDPRYRVTAAASAGAVAVAIRGNASLVSALADQADWSRLVSH